MTDIREHPGRGRLTRRQLLTWALVAGIAFVPMITTRAAAQATPPTESVLYNFTGGTDGATPGSLVGDGKGNFYGTGWYGGIRGGTCPITFSSGGCGVVFSIDSAGSETVLYTFTGGADGALPYGDLIRDSAGNLYGTTYAGGNASSSCPAGIQGCGVVFKVDPAGNETVLYTFTGGADGSEPYAGLVQDSAGNLYGTTGSGGKSGGSCGLYGCGVVFKVDPAGNETVLHTFEGPDGIEPTAPLILDPAGNLYGTTYVGTVFKLDPQGQHFRVLYQFTGGSAGSYPSAGLLRDAAGNLYGTTQYGGNTSSSCPFGSSGCGVVFKLDPSGTETVLHAFSGVDGAQPLARLIVDATGNLYGTTSAGGDTTSPACSAYGYGCGVVFRLDPSGKETVLHTFTGSPDGDGPEAAVLFYKGSLYGTTVDGGADTQGAIFKLQ